MDPKSNPDLSKQYVEAQAFRQYIETEVLKIVKGLAEKGETTKERIQEIAQLTLNLIKPNMTIEELYLAAVKLDDRYSELAPIVVKIMKEYEEKYNKKALVSVSALIKGGKYDEAQAMVKKVLAFKIAN